MLGEEEVVARRESFCMGQVQGSVCIDWRQRRVINPQNWNYLQNGLFRFTDVTRSWTILQLRLNMSSTPTITSAQADQLHAFGHPSILTMAWSHSQKYPAFC